MKYISAAAEAAIGGVNELTSIHAEYVANQRGRASRQGKRALRVVDEMAVARVVANAEMYLLMRVVTVVRPELLQPSFVPPPRDRATEDVRQATRNFRALQTLWRTRVGADLRTLNGWDDFWELREIRHVLVHRLGEWQPALDPKPLLEHRIQRLGIHPRTYRGLVPFTVDEVERASRVVFHIIDELEK